MGIFRPSSEKERRHAGKYQKHLRVLFTCAELSFPGGGGVLYIVWVRGRAIGKGIDFHEFGIRNCTDFHDFGIRNGIDFCNFRNWHRVGYAFSEN